MQCCSLFCAFWGPYSKFSTLNGGANAHIALNVLHFPLQAPSLILLKFFLGHNMVLSSSHSSATMSTVSRVWLCQTLGRGQVGPFHTVATGYHFYFN